MKLSFEHISKLYGDTAALQQIDLTLGSGVYGLLGPNGCLLYTSTSEPILLTQNLRERDLTIRSQHLLIAHAAHFLVCCRVNVRI